MCVDPGDNDPIYDVTDGVPEVLPRASSYTVSEQRQQQPVATPPDETIDLCLEKSEMFNSPNHPEDVSVFPNQKLSRRTLRFQRHWFDKHEWLHYDPTISGVICYYCSKAERLDLQGLARNREDTFILNGFRNWKDAL